MAHAVQSQQVVLEKLRKQLAIAVRSVQWSYAIFWSLSTRQNGVLEWGGGYYNGDIKTRKVQATELKADKIGLQRSEQLRELYKSLLEGDAGQQAKKSSPALSPEDLSDEEWYYLVCMSFVFNPGEGLPGRALANKQTIWLCNAQYADSKVFSRSLLAKSASIQTVVCFPYLEGVMELGVTELVTEDPSLVQHIKASLLDFSKPVCSEKSSSAAHNGDDDEDPMSTKINHEIVDSLSLENLCTPTDDIELEQEGINDLHGSVHEEFKRNSPDDCSDGCEYNHQTEESFMLEGLNGGVSQVQSWHFMDDEFSDDVLDSMNSSECISEAVVKQGKAVLSSKGKNVTLLQSQVFQEGNHTKLSSFDLGADDDLHYRRTVCVILKSSSQSIENPCFRSGDHKSSFFSWKKRAVDGLMPRVQQNMLKKILFAVPLIYGSRSLRFDKENGGTDCLKKLEGCETCKEHYKSDKQRVNDKFIVLRSMVPSISEIGKESILSDTINYLKQLESRVAELESCKGWIDHEAGHRSYMDMVDQTSDNDDIKKIDNGKRSWVNKRKALDIDEAELELDGVSPKDGIPLDLKVCTKEKEVLIEIRCPYREYMLLDIMGEINKLQLDVHSVQSSTLDGIFALTLKSKFRGAAAAPAGMIEQAIWKIAGKI
ncbi:PREDICTED: transcription factor EGL1-like isoform X2 [Populus euphratica]|uniref:Transcription factor EGL1-like isoform X2 n=1 Tax=Populus euphratica TaxID=75702 RepID=A0AAJ6U559_POPEU|nr:PREDICTED: transcription factor EGL1-like isoform X2 [Populus euphratica]